MIPYSNFGINYKINGNEGEQKKREKYNEIN